MLISKIALEKIKKIIENNYRTLLINVTGKNVLSESELRELENAGISTKNDTSLLSLIYYHNVLNSPDSSFSPTTVSEMVRQQSQKPGKATHQAAEEHLNENFAQLLEKLKASVQANVEALVREYNMDFRNKLVQTTNSPDQLKQPKVAALKATLRDISEDADRDWKRVAVTEVSNALGLGSVDRIAEMNQGDDINEVLVYRIPVNDAALCKFCRRFYLDDDGSPAVYKLTTIMGNGTNYGKKAADFKPVVGATHPNERCSGVLQLRPGWRVVPGGKLEYIGKDIWNNYIREKIRS